jgi:hypothetical protein
MRHDDVIAKAVQDIQVILCRCLPINRPTSHIETVAALRAIVTTRAVKLAIEKGNDASLTFVLRAVHRVLADGQVSADVTIDLLWEIVLNRPEIQGALGEEGTRLLLGKKPSRFW